MSESERDRLKRKLESGLAGAIGTQKLTSESRNAGNLAPVSEADCKNTELSLFLAENDVKAFEVRFRGLSGSFELLTLYPIDLNEADLTPTDAVVSWWLKYRCCLVDYWNECHPDKPIDHPEDWRCRNDKQ